MAMTKEERREYMREYMRKKRAEDPGYRERQNTCRREWHSRKMREDAAYREKRRIYKNARAKERRAEDPAFKAKCYERNEACRQRAYSSVERGLRYDTRKIRQEQKAQGIQMPEEVAELLALQRLIRRELRNAKYKRPS